MNRRSFLSRAFLAVAALAAAPVHALAKLAPAKTLIGWGPGANYWRPMKYQQVLNAGCESAPLVGTDTPASADWSDPRNWSLGRIPGKGDDVIFDGQSGDIQGWIADGVKSLTAKEDFKGRIGIEAGSIDTVNLQSGQIDYSHPTPFPTPYRADDQHPLVRIHNDGQAVIRVIDGYPEEV